MMENILKNNLKCPICRMVCVKEDEEEKSDDGDMDEETILSVADRIEEKMKETDVDLCLTRFNLPNETKGMRKRQKCELLAEQLTHITDDEGEASD
jgi:hypothetical protein